MPPRARQSWGPILLLVPLGLLLAGGAVAWRLTLQPPSWYTPPDPQDRQTARLAERVEYRLAEEAHRIRDEDEPWRLRMTEDQVNAWLASRLGAWASHTHRIKWPKGIGAPQIHFNDETISVAVNLNENGRQRYLVATLRPLLDDRQMTLVLESVALGRLSVPGGSVRTIMSQLDGLLPPGFRDHPTVKQLVTLLLDEQRIDPTIELADGRRVRLREVRFDEGALIVEAETGKTE